MTATSKRALVLGGGGITGIAWETGLLWGLAEAGLDLTTADRVIGTSAGSIVGSQITSDIGLEELYRRQLLPPAELGDTAPLAKIGPSVGLRVVSSLARSRGDVERFGRILGGQSIAVAARGKVPTVAERYEQVDRRIHGLTWPDRDLVVTAVDARTGELAAFGPRGPFPEVSLEDAVNASCSVPCVYPPIPIGDRVFVDGGVRSGANADLAAGCDPVVVLSPLDRGLGPVRTAAAQLEDLGVRHAIVQPDEGARVAIGKNVLDPAARPPSARAGYAQAAAHLAELRELWGATA